MFLLAEILCSFPVGVFIKVTDMCGFSHNYSCIILVVNCFIIMQDNLPYSDLSIKELIFLESSILCF